MGASKSKVKAKATVSQEQEALLSQIMKDYIIPSLEGIPEEFYKGFPTFNEQVPGLSNLESLSLAGMERLAMGEASGATGSEQFGQARGALSDILTRDDASVNDYFDRTIQDPTLKALREKVIPGIRGDAVGSGALFGSQTRGQESDIFADTMDSLVRERSRVGFEQADQRIAAAGALGQLQNQEAGYLQQLMAGGAVPREVETAQMGFRLQEFLRQLEERDKRIGLATEVGIAPTRATGTESTQGASDQAGGILGGILGCWVAAEYFPAYTVLWWNARDWIMEGWTGLLAAAFRILYRAFGPAIAWAIRRSPLLKRAIRPFFEWAARMGGK